MPKLTFRIDPLFLVLAFLLGWLNSPTLLGIGLWVIVVFVSILVHELGHALTALSFGQSAQVTFMALGGLTSRNGPQLNPLKEFLIVLNGPLAGFFLYFTCVLLLESTGLSPASPMGYMLLIGSYVNLIWTILNLFPVLPLDGGRLLMIICERIWGVKGGRFAYGISLVSAVVFGVFFFLIQEFFAGAIFLLFAFESYREFHLGRLVDPIDEDKEMKKSLAEGVENYKAGDLNKSEAILKDVHERTKNGLLYLTATYFLAKTYEEQGAYEKAYLILNEEKDKLDSSQLEELQRMAFMTKRFKEAALIGQEVFREKPGSGSAYINALSLAQLKEVVPAVGWLKTAIREGLENPLNASRHLGFDPIRDTPEFKRLVSQL